MSLAVPTKLEPQLARDLGVSHATAIVVGTIIGSGIFLVPSEMMQAVGSARLVYLAWFVGGLLSFFGALTSAELGAMRAQAGGEYIYVRDAYGPLGGFLYAWTTLLISKPASIATITTGFVRILGEFPVFSFFSHPILTAPLAVSYGQLAAIAAAVFISFLNYIGVKKAGEFQLVFTLLKVGIIVGIVVVCFGYRGGSWSNFASTFTGAKGGIAGFMAALVAALWAYDGWNDLNMVAGEIRQPERNIPMPVIAGVAVVGALYVIVNAGGRQFPPALLPRHFRRVAFLHDHQQHGIRVSPARAGGQPSLPGLGLPGGADVVRTRLSSLALLHLYRQSPELGHGFPGDSGRRTGFLLLSWAEWVAPASR